MIGDDSIFSTALLIVYYVLRMNDLLLIHLDEWFRACTIEKCSDDAADALANKAQIYFSLSLDKVGRPLENPDWRRGKTLSAQGKSSVCWHLLELRLNTGTHRNGKHYKNWLFDYSHHVKNETARLSSLKSGLKYTLQATVRDYCAGLIGQQEKEQRYGVYSFDEPCKEGAEQDHSYRKMAEALLDTTSIENTEKRFRTTEINELADAILNELSERQCVVLMVKCCEVNRPDAQKISLDHPAVLKAAGCGKSQLYAARNKLDDFLLKKMNEHLNEKCLLNNCERLGAVSLALADQLFFKIKSEKRYAPLLTYLEEIKNEP